MKCKDCTKRHPHCHSECEDYKKFIEENERRKQAIKEFNKRSARTIPSAQSFRLSKALQTLSKGGSKRGTDKHSDNARGTGSGSTCS